MYQNPLSKSTLFPILRSLDEAMASEVRGLGCRDRGCGGKLHQANYPRKPRGAPAEVEADPAYRHRLSFCCSVEGCRLRRTPASVLFLGPKVYVSLAVVLVSVLRQGSSARRLSRLREEFGVSARTVRRWRSWWVSSFVESAFWRSVQGRLMRPVSERDLPLSLLSCFSVSSGEDRVVQFLRFLRPLTSRSASTALNF